MSCAQPGASEPGTHAASHNCLASAMWWSRTCKGQTGPGAQKRCKRDLQTFQVYTYAFGCKAGHIVSHRSGTTLNYTDAQIAAHHGLIAHWTSTDVASSWMMRWVMRRTSSSCP